MTTQHDPHAVQFTKPEQPLPEPQRDGRGFVSFRFNETVAPGRTAESHERYEREAAAYDRAQGIAAAVAGAHKARGLDVPTGKAMEREVRFASGVSAISEVAENERQELRVLSEQLKAEILKGPVKESLLMRPLPLAIL